MKMLWQVGMLVAVASAAPYRASAEGLTETDVRAGYSAAMDDLEPIPVVVLAAFEGAEDRAFRERVPQRSTLTREIASWFPDPETSRAERVAAGLMIGGTLTHDEVLRWYVSGVFLGQGCFGAADAADAYFGKALADLTLAEAAFLAALPKAPGSFHPLRAPDRAVQRRDFVLGEMATMGAITKAEADAARATPLVVRDPLGQCSLPDE